MKRMLMIAAAFLAMVTAGLAVAPHVLPRLLSFYRHDIRFATRTQEKQIFVTIDDAPSRSTGEILRVLKKHHVPATFFVIADRVHSADQLDEIVTANQTLGNHLKTTRACSKLTLAEFQSDFDDCTALLKRFSQPRFFRPASDFGSKEQIAYAKAQGFEPIIGTVFPLDHWISDPTWLVRIARWAAIPGGILIMHDGDARGGKTASVLDRLIPILKADGYSFSPLERTAEQPEEPTTARSPGR